MLRRTPIAMAVFTLTALVMAIAPVQAQTMPTFTAVYAPGNPIVIGFSGLLDPDIDPQTDQDVVYALEIALAQMPTVSVGGVDFSLELLPQEDACSEQGGRDSARLFIQNPAVVGVIGSTCSSACRTLSIVFDQANYTSISPSCTASSLAVDFQSFNRVIINDDAQGVEGAIFVMDYLGLAEIAVIHDGTNYGLALADIFGASVAELGGDLVYEGDIERFQTDFTKTVAELEGSQPELVYFAGLASEAANLLKAIRAAGLSEMIFMVSDGVMGREFIEQSEGLAEGVYGSQPAAPDTDALDLFNAMFVRGHGRPSNTIYHPYAVDALNIFREAIEAVGELDADGNLVIDRLALRAYISNYGQDRQIDGLSGRLLCNGDGECALGGIAFYQVIDGAFVALDASVTIDLGY